MNDGFIDDRNGGGGGTGCLTLSKNAYSLREPYLPASARLMSFLIPVFIFYKQRTHDDAPVPNQRSYCTHLSIKLNTFSRRIVGYPTHPAMHFICPILSYALPHLRGQLRSVAAGRPSQVSALVRLVLAAAATPTAAPTAAPAAAPPETRLLDGGRVVVPHASERRLRRHHPQLRRATRPSRTLSRHHHKIYVPINKNEKITLNRRLPGCPRQLYLRSDWQL